MCYFEKLRSKKIVIFGCGGVGSEILKLLQGNNITAVDFDRIEISNLNRQFFYIKSDCGKYKSQTIAEKINCKYLIRKIEDLNVNYINEFNILFCCLDDVSSRMELNYLFKQSTCELLIDCGVEGMKAHVKLVNQINACLYCIKDLYHGENDPYLCSLASPEQKITGINRQKILISMIYRIKAIYSNLSQSNFNQKVSDEVISRVVREFNRKKFQMIWKLMRI